MAGGQKLAKEREKAGWGQAGRGVDVQKGPNTQAEEVWMFFVGNEKPLEVSWGLVTWLWVWDNYSR